MRFLSPIARRLAAFALPALFASAVAGEIGPFTGPEADAEAARLHERANNYVNNVVEGGYSYSYVQFHWKRAGTNIDRILRAYPSSPTAALLRSGAGKVGPFTPEYFKERVLPRLEEKKVASFDAINCAIFLYNLESNQDQAGRRELLATIIRTLCRQIRWGEALGFPVLDDERPWLWREVILQAAIYNNDKLVDELLANITSEDKPQLLAAVAHGLAFRGEALTDLDAFLKKHGETPALRAAIFSGLVRRELPIQRALALKQPLKGLYSGVDGIQKPEQTADLPAWLATLPAGSERAAADLAYAQYLAALGRLDEARRAAPAGAQADLAAAHAGWLVTTEDYEGAQKLPRALGLDGTQTDRFHLRLLELFAEYGRDQEAAAVRALIPAALGPETVYREFNGRLFSTEKQLVVREHTFSDLPLRDPNYVGRLICEWSLTPNRTLRGAAPWDAIVHKFAPGFENLPPPKDRKKMEAAGR